MVAQQETNSSRNSTYEALPNLDRSLHSEMEYLRANFKHEGLPQDWRFLSKTGFSVKSQVDMLYESLDSSTSFSHEDLETWLAQTEEDVKGFIIEYLTQKLTFPIYLRSEIVDNRRTIVAPRYGGKRMIDLVLEQERNGVVKKTLEEKLEPFLLNASEGSIAVLTSPDGWSGLKTDMKNGVGEDIVFPDSQTQIYQKMGDDIVGFTIRTDLTLDEHRKVIKTLGGRQPQSDDVCEFVSETCLLDGNDYPGIGISDIVKVMQQSRLQVTERFDAYKGRSWNEVYEDFKNSDNLWRFDDVTGEIFEEFKDFVETYPFTKQELEEATAVTILRIARALGVEKKRTMVQPTTQAGFVSVSEVRGVPILSYGALLAEVEERGGCAGGGSSRKKQGFQALSEAILNTLNPRYITIENSSESEKYSFDQPGPCKVCGEDVNCGPCQICKPCDDNLQREQAKKNVLIEGIETELSL